MLRKNLIAIASAALMALPAWQASAGVSAAEAERLGKDLTPVGAEKAGNADGTIPAWAGGLPVKPIDRSVGYVDPYADDKVQFTITSENLAQHKDRLSAGQIAMFEKYPDTYKMNVYPTRRSAAYPTKVAAAIRENAVNGSLTGTDRIQGVVMATPFPIPKSGEEIITNHKMRYIGPGVKQYYNQAAVTPGGKYTLVKILQEVKYLYSQPNTTAAEISKHNKMFYFLQSIIAPARLAGSVLLVHEPIDQVKELRSAWAYNPGQRRVRRAPNVGYDNPGTASDGLRTNDQNGVINGALDRYDWKIVGKKEMYVPYNAYLLDSRSLKYDDIVKKGHINQDLARYELHRVWVVESTVKPGMRHLYKRRTYYVDEDSYLVLAVDVYDNRDQLWRVQEGHAVNFYDVPYIGTSLETIYDLQSGRYLALSIDNEDPPYDFSFNQDDSYFTPAALRAKGRR